MPRPPAPADTAAAARAPALETVLEGLNEEQRDAVTHAGGPLLIVAGAGTGKTQVITRRIAWLIATRRARPEQILALTFTDKAAAEMEARVDVLVPFGFVGATISTFNAFCDRLVREHAVELGLTSQLRVESQAEILVFLRERLFDLGLRRYLPLGSPDSHLRALLAVFDRARNEDVSPAEYVAWAEAALAAAADDAARDRAEGQLEVARAFEAYERLLLASGRIDFGSQVGLALRLLRERPYLRREYRERYRAILVDEFQDTNHVQFELVKLLAGDGHDVTVVGDDDQSIYRFRGAKVENLLGFVEAFPGARQVLLRRNYRSGQRILDTAHRLIQSNNPARLEAQLGLDKRLESQRRGPDGAAFEGTVEHRRLQTASDEAEWIARDVAEGIAAGRAPGDFAVLARAHASLDAVALALQGRGIRFRRVGQRRLYGRPEVALCLNALRSIASPDEGGPVYFVLDDPLFGADPVDLARLGERARRTHRGLLRVAVEAMDDGTLAPATRDAIARFSALHRELAAHAARRPTAEILYQFVHDSGLLGRLTAGESAEDLERVQNLGKLFGIVSRVGQLLKEDRVAAFVPHLDLLIELGDDPAAAEIESDEDAVSLLTAHNAKGLEFPVVYLVHLVEQRFPPYPRGESLAFPPELRHGRPDDKEEHYREERRLFYVGVTRARDRLVLCHANDYGGRRAARTSRFVMEALALTAPPKGAAGASAAEAIARFAPVPEPPPAPIAPLPPDQALVLSHYQVEDYRTCPRRYYYAHLANVPLPPKWSRAYGKAVHHAIEVCLRHRMKGLPIGADDVLAAYRDEWSNEGFLNPQHEEHVYRAGEQALRDFVAAEERSGRVPLAIEMDFKFKLGRDVVTGRFDRIDERDGGIVLVDYKTTGVDDRAEAESRAKDAVANGQLGLYALGYLETRGVRPASAELVFVGAGITANVAIGDEALAAARERVAEAAAGIREARLAATPDPHKCARCDYARFCPFSAARGDR